MYRSESLGEGGGVIPITGDGSSLTNYLPGSWGRSPCELFAQPQSVLVRSAGFELWQIQICITKRPPAQKKYHGRELESIASGVAAETDVPRSFLYSAPAC